MSHKPKFEKDYYKRCVAKGIDYVYYGNWQKQYAKMVVFVTEIYRNESQNKTILDVGTACGVNLLGFKETAMFTKYIGIDISQFLINLGNEKLQFKEGELILDSCTTMLSIEDNSIDLVHCSQLFEHLGEGDVNLTLEQFKRVMKDDAIGFITLCAIKPGQTEQDVLKQDESHITVMTEGQWYEKIKEYGFTHRKDVARKMKSAMFYPGEDSKNFYEHYADDWSVFIFTK